MAEQTLTFAYSERIESCQAGQSEIQTGEEVIFELKGKNPLWPSSLKAIVSLVSNAYPNGCFYTFTYDDADLNGGPTIEYCDISEIRCYGCCDANLERLEKLISVLPVTENTDGTFTWNG